MGKNNTSVYVDEEVVEHSKRNPHIKSLSNWINTSYKEAHMGLEKLGEELERISRRQEEIRKKIKEKKKMEDTSMLSDQEWEWFKTEGLERIQKPEVERESLRRFFNHEFGEDLSSRQFRIYLEKAEKKKEKG